MDVDKTITMLRNRIRLYMRLLLASDLSKKERRIFEARLVVCVATLEQTQALRPVLVWKQKRLR